MSRNALIGFLVILTLSCLPLRAQIVTYSTFGPGDKFDTEDATAIGGPNDQAIAETFVPTVSGTLDNITLAVSGFLNSSQVANVELFSSSPYGVGVPELTIGSLTIPANSNYGGLLDVTLSGPPVDLVANQTYYLALTPTDGEENSIGWNWASPAELESCFISFTGGSGYTFGEGDEEAFSVSVAPEPSAWMLAMISMGSVVLICRSRGRWFS